LPRGRRRYGRIRTTRREPAERELERLHVELVKLQRWVVAKGLKVCIVFEGRDGAGKGGTIKAITERGKPGGYVETTHPFKYVDEEF